MVTKVLAGLAIVAVAAVAFLAVPAVRHLRESSPPPEPAIRLWLPAPAGSELGSGNQTLDSAISPDQRQIVFVATLDGTAALWRRALTSERSERIPGTEGAQLPAWKQTGNAISFFSGGVLRQVSLTDGAVRDLTPAGTALGASWLPDGSLLYAMDARGVIRRLRNGTVSEATRLRPGDVVHAYPIAVSNDVFVYTATLETGGRVVRLVDAAGEHELTTTAGHGQLVGDTLLYVRDNVLLAQQVTAETRQISGRSVPLALDVGTDSSGHSFFTASPRVLVTAPVGSRPYQLTWLSLVDGTRTTIREPGDYWQVRLSPDDRFAALTQTTPLVRTLDVVLAPMADSGYVEPLTRAVAADSDPVWSPDGRTVVFRSLQDGPPRLYTHAAHDQDGMDRLVPMSTADETPTDWSREHIIVHAPGTRGDRDLWTVNGSSGMREAIVSPGFNETDARLSPDGRWLAYVADDSGQSDVYASPWPRGARVRVSFAGGTRPRWSRDGRAVFFVRGTQILRADLTTGGFTTPRSVFDVRGIRDFDAAHHRDALLALLPSSSSTTTTTSVIVDWRSLIN